MLPAHHRCVTHLALELSRILEGEVAEIQNRTDILILLEASTATLSVSSASTLPNEGRGMSRRTWRRSCGNHRDWEPLKASTRTYPSQISAQQHWKLNQIYNPLRSSLASFESLPVVETPASQTLMPAALPAFRAVCSSTALYREVWTCSTLLSGGLA